MACHFSVQLVQQAVNFRLRLGFDLGGTVDIAIVDPAFGIEVRDQRALQCVGQPYQPLVKVRTFDAAQWWGQAGLRVRIT